MSSATANPLPPAIRCSKIISGFTAIFCITPYRRRLVPYLVDNGFYWHVLIAHAWIMHSHFHVDIGARGDLAFYANAVNREADWSRSKR